MRFLIQHTEQPASIHIVSHNTSNQRLETKDGSIPHGCIIYVGFHRDDIQDYQTKIDKFVNKIQSVKLFRNPKTTDQRLQTKIDSSLTDTGGSILLVPNFTLYSRNQKGSSVDYTHSASFADGKLMRDYLLSQLTQYEIPHITGSFGAEMHITATVDGPINHIWDY